MTFLMHSACKYHSPFKHTARHTVQLPVVTDPTNLQEYAVHLNFMQAFCVECLGTVQSWPENSQLMLTKRRWLVTKRAHSTDGVFMLSEFKSLGNVQS